MPPANPATYNARSPEPSAPRAGPACCRTAARVPVSHRGALLFMALLNLANLHLAYGHVALLDGVDFSLDAG